MFEGDVAFGAASLFVLGEKQVLAEGKQPRDRPGSEGLAPVRSVENSKGPGMPPMGYAPHSARIPDEFLSQVSPNPDLEVRICLHLWHPHSLRILEPPSHVAMPLHRPACPGAASLPGDRDGGNEHKE